MIVVYPFSLPDEQLALKNAQWINDLGGCKGHEVYVLYDKRCSSITVDAILTQLRAAFDHVYVLECHAEIDGWPEGANYFFRMAAAKLQTKPNTQYFMWMEPDAIPVKKGWLDDIQREFESVAKPMGKFFMGDRVQVEDIPLHMSGIGIYPLPLHAYAGEAYRAAEVAWDMAAKDQIVPKAHFTKLIEHAWKHPSFTNDTELATQIRKEAVLFHSSKDGSLIDILRGSSTQSSRQIADLSAVQVGGPAPSGLSGREVGATSFPQPQNEVHAGSSPVQAATTCDIFIRTYPGDYDWLFHCVASIGKFCRGFRKLMIVSTDNPPIWWNDGSRAGLPPSEWKIMQDETPDGYLAQQITKMYADVVTDYQPDYILHLDSDVIFTRPVTPESFMHDGKIVWYYTPYSEIETPWQPIIEKFMGRPVEFEFMRRFPIMVPRWLYPRIREFCHKKHGMIMSDYIRMQPPRAFSEFNVMGAYAWHFHKEMMYFVNTLGTVMDYPLARQFHSWGGITPEVKKELNHIFGEPIRPDTPNGVKELKNGLWVIDGDTHVSRWIEQQDRLDHDQNSLPFILPLIKPGDIVVDAGAFVGDHTIAYAKAVGPEGKVYAFEPNPVAVECFLHNLHGHENVIMVNSGLSNRDRTVPLSGNNGNAAGAYVGDHMPVANVKMARLDDYEINPDFIKLDIEGCEVEALIGAQETIRRCHPTMVIEVNVVALDRQGQTVYNLFEQLKSYGYEWKIMQENCSEFDPMYDIICSYKKSPEATTRGREGGFTRCADLPPPVTTPLSSVAEMRHAVEFLAAYAAHSPKDRWKVMMALYKAGLTPKKNKGKKKPLKK